MATRWRTLITSCLAALLLSACVIRVVYNQLDWLAIWYMESYVEFTDPQEKQAREFVRETIAWHRSTQLPKYADLVRQLLGRVGEPFTQEFVAQQYASVLVLWDELLVQVVPGSAALLYTLSPDQVDEVFEQLEVENEELREDYSGETVEVRRQKQAKAISRAFRRVTGRLNASQESMIREEVATTHDVSADWVERRQAWQSAFRQLFQSRGSSAEFAGKLSDLMLNPNQFDSPGYRDLVRENQRQSFGLVADVLNSLTPGQTVHFQDKLNDYLTDLQTLIREGTGQQESS